MDTPPLFSCSPALPISWGLQPHRWATPECTRGHQGWWGQLGPYPVGLSLTDIYLVAHPQLDPFAAQQEDHNSLHCRLWYYKCVCVCVCVCVAVLHSAYFRIQCVYICVCSNITYNTQDMCTVYMCVYSVRVCVQCIYVQCTSVCTVYVCTIYNTVFRSGNVYEGEWSSNQKEGQGTMYWKDSGQVYKGEWLNGKQVGVAAVIMMCIGLLVAFFWCSTERGSTHGASIG